MFSSFPSLAHFSFCLVSPSDLIESLGLCYCLFTADFQIFYLWLRTWSPESKPIASEWPIRNLYLDDPQACLKFISSSFISWFSYDQEKSIWMNDTPQARLGRHSQVLLHSCSQYFIWSCCFNCLTSQIHWFLSISADTALVQVIFMSCLDSHYGCEFSLLSLAPLHPIIHAVAWVI